MKIVVTGGAGFIGSHIVDNLIKIGHQVIVIDNLSTGKSEYINPKAKFYQDDVTDYSCVKRIFSIENPDLVNHHAAQVNVRLSLSEPDVDARINIMGSLNIIRASVENKIRKLIFASTGGAIYGDPETRPVSEDFPTMPISPYGVAKLSVEQYIKVIAGINGIPFTILRYANVYGPRQIVKGESGVIAIFTQKLLERKNPTIFGDGSHTRDYVYVSDVVKANVLAMDAQNDRTYNVGMGTEIDVNGVYEILESKLKTGLKPVHGEEVQGEVKHVSLDCSLIRRELGWSPDYDFDKGVMETVNYYREKS